MITITTIRQDLIIHNAHGLFSIGGIAETNPYLLREVAYAVTTLQPKLPASKDAPDAVLLKTRLSLRQD